MNAFVPTVAARRPVASLHTPHAAATCCLRPAPRVATCCASPTSCCLSLGSCSKRAGACCATGSCARPLPTATPFFASSAFGAPMPTRAILPQARAPVRMDVTIVVGDNEPVESALRRFKKDVTRSGHLFELRRRRYFETNTEKRIRKAAAARRKARMARNSSNQQKNRQMQQQ